jgi:hypothetical protein
MFAPDEKIADGLPSMTADRPDKGSSSTHIGGMPLDGEG